MGKSTEPKNGNHFSRFARKIGEREERKRLAGLRKKVNVLEGFAVFGRIGWTLVMPGVIGVVLGAWIDSRFPGSFSWALVLLAAGIGIGCLNVWDWLEKQHERMRGNDHAGNHHS